MEIPEDKPETTPRFKNTEYWPYAKFIPVLSKAALEILKEKTPIDIVKDNNEEESLRITINHRFHAIPRILTSKNAISFLGFTKERAEELWQTLVKASPPAFIPTIEDGGEFAFWMELKLAIGDDIYATSKRFADERDDPWNKAVFSRIGLTEAARLQPLKVTREQGQTYTYIQEQKPQDLLPLIQRYFFHRWNLLAKMDKMILTGHSAGTDWWKKLTEELEKITINLEVLYDRVLIWEPTEW